MNGKYCRKCDLLSVIAKHFLLGFAWSKQTKIASVLTPCAHATPLTTKHLQVLNCIRRAGRYNYLDEDEACNDRHYPNKAIILSWHVSYASNATLPGLGVANHSALQPDLSSLFLFTTYTILGPIYLK